jgi:hypothetical protein
MALEASHIRFALDIKEVLGVTDINAYVSGSVYPDSRYVSGIDRAATHPEDYHKDPMFRTSDFRKGWYAHLLADDIQQECMKEMIPETQTGTGEESWIKRSAIKILQDIEDARLFDLAAYLPCLSHMENPNGEELSAIRRYQEIFPRMYADIGKYDIGAAAEMWRKFGVGDEIAEKMRATAERYSSDPAVMKEVRVLYQAMLEKAALH